MTHTKTLQEVVGVHVRNLRGDASLMDLAAAGRHYGATWSASSVLSIERGTTKLTPGVLLHLQLALGMLTQRETGWTELLGVDYSDPTTDHPVEIATGVTVGTHDACRWLAGETNPADVVRAANLSDAVLSFTRGVESGEVLDSSPHGFDHVVAGLTSTPTEDRIAQSLGISPERLHQISLQLWSEPFQRRRDRLAGVGVSPQKRGIVSRRLKAEIQEVIDGGQR